jgi:hypothetical protein
VGQFAAKVFPLCRNLVAQTQHLPKTISINTRNRN